MGDDDTQPPGDASPEAAMGARIRDLRVARQLTLRSLASRAQTSPGFLSQLERGQVNASVGTLRKLAEGLGITLPDLFSDEDVNNPKVLHRSQRPEIHVNGSVRKYLLSQKPLRSLEVYVAELQPGGNAGEAYTHGDAQEMLVVVAGEVVLELAGAEHRLAQGDSAEYRTSTLHTLRNDSQSPAEVLWIISPPTLDIS